MKKIQIDLPDDLNDAIILYKVENKVKNKALAIIDILQNLKRIDTNGKYRISKLCKRNE